MLIEIFGYIGSVLVVVSMLMSSVVKLRVINTAGSIISGSYAVICGAFPLVLMNACLIVINIYNLYKLLRTEQQYDLTEGKADDAALGYFLTRYSDDIKLYFPGFEMEVSAIDKAYMVYCNGTPAGVMLGKDRGDGAVDVMLDYSVPAYRDCSVGKFLYSKLPASGVRVLQFSQKESKNHTAYMTKMGFVKENGVYVKMLS